MTLSWTTLASTISGILAVLMGVMTQVLGCTVGNTDFSAVCTASWLPSNYIGYAAIAFGAFAFIAKLLGPGGPLANLFGAKAVVLTEDHPKSGIGTTTPAEVARP